MAVAITQIGGPFGSIIVRDTDCNNSATTIANPTTGSIIQIAIDNPNTTAVYYKMADTGSPVVGTTAADLGGNRSAGAMVQSAAACQYSSPWRDLGP